MLDGRSQRKTAALCGEGTCLRGDLPGSAWASETVFFRLLPHLHWSIHRREWLSLTVLRPLPLSPLHSLLTRLPPHSPVLPPRHGAAALPPISAQRRLPRSVAQLYMQRRSEAHAAAALLAWSGRDCSPSTQKKTVYCDYILDCPINTHHPRPSLKTFTPINLIISPPEFNLFLLARRLRFSHPIHLFILLR